MTVRKELLNNMDFSSNILKLDSGSVCSGRTAAAKGSETEYK